MNQVSRRLIMLSLSIALTIAVRAQYQQLQEKIKLNLYHTNAMQIIEALDQQSSYHFTFAPEQLLGKKIDSFKIVSLPLSKVLQQLERSFSLSFVVKDDHIIVSLVKQPTSPPK